MTQFAHFNIQSIVFYESLNFILYSFLRECINTFLHIVFTGNEKNVSRNFGESSFRGLADRCRIELSKGLVIKIAKTDGIKKLD